MTRRWYKVTVAKSISVMLVKHSYDSQLRLASSLISASLKVLTCHVNTFHNCVLGHRSVRDQIGNKCRESVMLATIEDATTERARKREMGALSKPELSIAPGIP